MTERAAIPARLRSQMPRPVGAGRRAGASWRSSGAHGSVAGTSGRYSTTEAEGGAADRAGEWSPRRSIRPSARSARDRTFQLAQEDGRNDRASLDGRLEPHEFGP